MALNPAWYVFAIVGVLAYVGLTTILRVLAAHYHREKSVHDLVRNARQAKLDYYRELAIRQGLIADDSQVLEAQAAEVNASSSASVPASVEPDAPPVTAGKIEPAAAPAKQAA